MEHARYWMWTKQKHGLSSHLQASVTRPACDDSWEEQAFAEDAAGPLGGCIWPPRSYSCSFCRREFRSAQALGGHMNIHRRDRARLKQSPTPHNEIIHQQHQNHHSNIQNPYLGFHHPPQICTLVYGPNPNSNPSIVPSPSSPSRVLTILPTQENCGTKTLFPPFPSFDIEEHLKRSPKYSPNLDASGSYSVGNPRNAEEKSSRILESGRANKVDCVKTTDLSVSLNLVLRRACSTISDGEDEGIGCKRRRTNTSCLPFFFKSNSVDESEVIEISPCSSEELDLELRLGDRPKVK